MYPYLPKLKSNSHRLNSTQDGLSNPFRPIDTLHSSGNNPAVQNNDGLRAASRISPERPSSKRQKTDHHGAFTESRLVPLDDIWGASQDSISRMEPQSQSATSTHEERAVGSGVLPEYRVVNAHLGGVRTGRRHRRPRDTGSSTRGPKLVSLRTVGSRDPIVDASDESSSEQRLPSHASTKGRRLEPSQARRQPFRDPADAEIVRSSGKAPGSQQTKLQYRATQPQGTKRSITGDLDELSEDVNYNTATSSRRTNINGTNNYAPQSASISHRADIISSRYAPSTPNPLDVEGLAVKGAFCTPGYIYSSAIGTPGGYESDDPCVLRAAKGPSTALLAFNLDGSESSKSDWLRVDLARVLRVHYSRGCPKIKIAQSSSVKKAIGATMFLEFWSWDDADHLIKWIGAKTAEPDRLESL